MWRRGKSRLGWREMAWVLAGFVAAQALLGLGVDRFWPAVRDPEFMMLRAGLAEQQARAPGRLLVLTLGSSRTAQGLRADRLSESADAHGPLVFNYGIPTGGPMLQQIVLRR